jgi:hypothetical protein
MANRLVLLAERERANEIDEIEGVVYRTRNNGEEISATQIR